jgi:plastocyanin
MKEEQEEGKKQSLNLSILTTIVLLLANVIIVASVLPSTLISNIITMKPAFAQEQTSTGIISKVRTLLNQTINEYRNKNYTGAQSLATSAYLDNFEFIEAPLDKHDKALKNETEIMLREQLRQMIKDKSPQDNVQQLIDKININLDKAQTLLAGRELPVQRLHTISSTTNHTNITTTSSSTALNATNKVKIIGDEVKEPYMPHTFNINTGDKVSWINSDVEIHTVTSGSENSTDKGRQFDSGLLNANQTFEHTFNNAGIYNYFCTIHPTMTGVVNVK